MQFSKEISKMFIVCVCELIEIYFILDNHMTEIFSNCIHKFFYMSQNITRYFARMLTLNGRLFKGHK